MKRKYKLSHQLQLLKQQAEERYLQINSNLELDSEIDPLKLVHELHVYKIELEMQKEELLKESERVEAEAEKYKSIFDFAPMGYIALDHKGNILEINTTGINMLGSKRTAIISKNFNLFISKKYRPVLNNFLNNIFESEGKESCEVEFEIKDGPPLFVLFEGRVAAKKEYCHVSMADITELKLTQHALIESEAKYKSFFHEALSGDFSMNAEGIIKECNESFLKIFGYNSSDEIIGKNITLLYQNASEFESLVSLLKQVKKIRNIEATRKCKDGKLIQIIENKVASFDQHGNITEIKGYIFDITERKAMETELRKSETKLKNIINLLPVGLSVIDTDFKHIDQNEALSQIIKLTKEEIKTGKFKNRKYIQPDGTELQPTDMPSYKALKGKCNIPDQEIGICTDNNELIWINVSAAFVEGIGAILVTKDITEQKRIFENLKQNEISLRELNASKDKFFSIISHDLRGPFNSVIGYSEILGEQIRNKDFDGVEIYAKHIQNSSWRAMDLLTNLLDWSRSQTGRLEFKPEIMNSACLVDSSIELLQEAAHQKLITVYNGIPANTEIYGDKAMLSTILRNLISNAIKFTHKGGRIVIGAEPKHDELIVSVSDNGVGIDTKIIAKLFRLGESISTTGTQRETGSGLGLVLCNEFIEKHGGKIWIESELGKGTSVHFTVPKG